jgi:hypothetical protein
MGDLFQKIVIGLLLLCMTLSAVAVPKKCRKSAYAPKQLQAIVQSAGKDTTHYAEFDTRQYCTAASVFILEEPPPGNIIFIARDEGNSFIQLFLLFGFIHPPFAPPRKYQLQG